MPKDRDNDRIIPATHLHRRRRLLAGALDQFLWHETLARQYSLLSFAFSHRKLKGSNRRGNLRKYLVEHQISSAQGQQQIQQLPTDVQYQWFATNKMMLECLEIGR